MPAKAHAAIAQAVRQLLLFFAHRIDRNLFGPLKGRKGFRNEKGGAHRDIQPFRALILRQIVPDRDELSNKRHDAFYIVFGLGGQSEHEVEFQAVPAV